MFGSFGWMELLLILIIVLIIFGAGKIPQLGEGLGKAIKGFKKSVHEADAIDVTATIQSLFGVGVLLFGTPILLVLGYDFITALTILLPISLTINLLQVSKDYRHVQVPFYRQVLTLSLIHI